MKYLPYIIMLLCLAASCKQKQQSDDIIVSTANQKAKPKGPARMQDYNQQSRTEWQGAEYTIDISRTACDSLARQKDEHGQVYIDNEIALTVGRGGSVWLSRHLTKATFAAHIPENFAAKGILEGFVFDKVDGGKLIFGASVSLPGTDEYYPLRVSFSPAGTMTVEPMEEEM